MGAARCRVLPDRGERDRLGEWMIIETDHRHVLGDPKALFDGHSPSSHRHLVGDRKHCGGRLGQGQQAGHGVLPSLDREVTGVEQVGIDDDSRSGERLFVPLTAAPRDLGSHGIVGHALDETDPSVAELQQVVDGETSGRDVIGAHRRQAGIAVADGDGADVGVPQRIDLIGFETNVDHDKPVDPPVHLERGCDEVASCFGTGDTHHLRVVAGL